MFRKCSVILILSLFVVDLNARQAKIESSSSESSSAASSSSSLQFELANPHYYKCANTCEKIWSKWDKVTNKELCQQQCLMMVMQEVLKQASENE